MTVTEGNTGSMSATFTLTLSAASQPVTVHYPWPTEPRRRSTTPPPPGDVTILAGNPTQIYSDDPRRSTAGADRGVHGQLEHAIERVHRRWAGPAPSSTTSANQHQRHRGDGGGTGASTRSGKPVGRLRQAVTVHYVTANGSATAISDYTGITDTTLTIPAGQLSQTFTVAVLGDRLPEPTENFFINLSSPSGNSTIADGQGVVTILDNEPRVFINDVSKQEGNGNGKGTTLFVFTVSLSVAYDQAVTIHFATADGTAKVSDNDYVAASGTLTFAPGETTKTITVSVKGDKKNEPDEWFVINLSGASSNALIGDLQGRGWILNDATTAALTGPVAGEGAFSLRWLSSEESR